MKALLIVILIPFFIFNPKINNSFTGYIMIQHLGDPTKPDPILIFDYCGKFDTTFEGFYVHKINVAEKQLQDLKEIIEQHKNPFGADTLQYPIGIRIVFNQEDKTMLLNHKRTIGTIFNQIVGYFQTPPEKELVEATLNQLERIISTTIPPRQ